MIKLEWKKFIRTRMWFGMYWAKNGGRDLNREFPYADVPEIPGWASSNQWWDWFIPMQKR